MNRCLIVTALAAILLLQSIAATSIAYGMNLSDSATSTSNADHASDEDDSCPCCPDGTPVVLGCMGLCSFIATAAVATLSIPRGPGITAPFAGFPTCLGPVPLGPDFTGTHLWVRSRGRRVAVKSFIMTPQIVVGVGNIYASEALYAAGIHPKRAAGRISPDRYELLATAIRTVLERAIRAGGTTLRDYHGGDGAAGYFRQELAVYDREGLPCLRCRNPVRAVVIGQRSSYYCRYCQT